MAAACREIARGGATSDPVISAYLRAEHVNKAAGGAVIKPWEANELPDEWLVGAQLLNANARQRQVDAHVTDYFSRWRENHPGYRVKQ